MLCHFFFEQIAWKEKEATGEFTTRGNVDALHMVLGKDHKGRVKKAFCKECVATQASTMAPEDVAILKSEIEKRVLEKVATLFRKMGLPHVDLASINIEDQQSQHGDPKVLVKPTPDLITPVAQNPTPERITPLLKILSQHTSLW